MFIEKRRSGFARCCLETPSLATLADSEPAKPTTALFETSSLT
jgi:hypothetical protein